MSRKPPHNLAAERDVIGSMLTTRDAITAAGAHCDADDFYDPTHRAVVVAVFDLAAEGAGVDVATVADRTGVPRERLLAIQAATPAAMNAATYARTVADAARARRAISVADEIADSGWDADLDRLDKLLAEVDGRLVARLPQPEAIELDALLADSERVEAVKPWIVPGMLRQRERYVLTGAEGWGKSEYVRQFAVCVAAGIHPFTRDTEGMPGPQSVLIVDLQDDEADLAEVLRRTRPLLGERYRQTLRIVTRPAGMNLLARADERWMEGLIARYAPTLVCIGPLRKSHRSTTPGLRKWDEEVVEELQALLDRWRVQYGCAWMIEGHAGHDRDTWRVRGSSLWYDWPEFGHGLNPVNDVPREVEVKKWRGDRRVQGRAWPRRLYGGSGPLDLPWRCDNGSEQRMVELLALEQETF